MDNKHVKDVQISFSIKEMLIKTILTDHYTLDRKLKLNTQTINKC